MFLLCISRGKKSFAELQLAFRGAKRPPKGHPLDIKKLKNKVETICNTTFAFGRVASGGLASASLGELADASSTVFMTARCERLGFIMGKEKCCLDCDRFFQDCRDETILKLFSKKLFV